MNVPSFKVKDGLDLGQKKDNTSTKLEKRKRNDFQEVEKSVYWTLIFSIK